MWSEHGPNGLWEGKKLGQTCKIYGGSYIYRDRFLYEKEHSTFTPQSGQYVLASSQREEKHI